MPLPSILPRALPRYPKSITIAPSHGVSCEFQLPQRLGSDCSSSVGLITRRILLAKMVSSVDSVIQEFEELTKDVRSVQVDTLRRILEESRDAEYLEGLGLGGKTDPESFRACVPLVFHSDVKGYIKRIADGESSPILTGKPIKTLTLSSGTTEGEPKYVPFNDFLVQDAMKIYKTSFAFRNSLRLALAEKLDVFNARGDRSGTFVQPDVYFPIKRIVEHMETRCLPIMSVLRLAGE